MKKWTLFLQTACATAALLISQLCFASFECPCNFDEAVATGGSLQCVQLQDDSHGPMVVVKALDSEGALIEKWTASMGGLGSSGGNQTTCANCHNQSDPDRGIRELNCKQCHGSNDVFPARTKPSASCSIYDGNDSPIKVCDATTSPHNFGDCGDGKIRGYSKCYTQLLALCRADNTLDCTGDNINNPDCSAN